MVLMLLKSHLDTKDIINYTSQSKYLLNKFICKVTHFNS